MNRCNSIIPKDTTSKSTLYTWNSRWIWEYESPWSIFEKFKLANETNDIGIFKIFGTDQIKLRTKALYSFEERDLNTLRSFDEDILFRVLGVNLKETMHVNINNLIGAFSNSKKLSFYIEKNLHFCPECIKLGYHSIFHQFKLIDTCPFHGNTIENKCPKCHTSIPYILTDKWARSPYKCKCGYQFYTNNEINYFIKEWSLKTKLVIKLPNLVKWLSIENSVKFNLKDFIINEKIAKFHTKNLIPFSLSVIDKGSQLNSLYIHHKINNQKNKQLIKTRKHYPFEVQMQQIIERFNIEIFELNWITFRGVEELILKYIHINYKKHDETELSQINVALKMWQKCVSGFEYYLNNRNSLNVKAWHNNSFFESIDEVQVIDDFYFELKNLFTRIDEHNIINFKWIFNRVISIILVNHFFNLVEHCEIYVNRGLEVPYLGVKYENIPFYLIKYNCDLFELHWWNKYNSL